MSVTKFGRLSTASSYKQAVMQADTLVSAGTPMICFFCETTGKDAEKDRIVHLIAAKIVFEEGIAEIGDTLNLYFNPRMAVSAHALNRLKMSQQQLDGYDDEASAAQEIERFFGKKPFLCGFDSKRLSFPFLRAYYKRHIGHPLDVLMHIDTRTMAQEVLPLEDYGLYSVAYASGADNRDGTFAQQEKALTVFRMYMSMVEVYRNMLEREPNYYGDKCVNVIGCNYWEAKKDESVKRRVYVQTEPASRSYYDLDEKLWVSQDPEINLLDLRTKALNMLHVVNDKSFVAACRKER